MDCQRGQAILDEPARCSSAPGQNRCRDLIGAFPRPRKAIVLCPRHSCNPNAASGKVAHQWSTGRLHAGIAPDRLETNASDSINPRPRDFF